MRGNVRVNKLGWYGEFQALPTLPVIAESMFHILIVDDDPAGAYLLGTLMKNLRRQPELHFVRDGVEALDFLHRRGSHTGAPRPHLILLDINMPRLGGLETLSAIKSDPELYVIPVIMLSGSNSPQDVLASYHARANGYLQKPVNLERSEQLVQAFETFWMEFATLPEHGERTLRIRDSGNVIASPPGEERSRAMQESEGKIIAQPSRKSGCQEHDRLLDEFGAAVHELLQLHQQQFQAIVEEDNDCTRFDLLIHMANEKKHQAKYAYLRHVVSHGCSNHDDVKQA